VGYYGAAARIKSILVSIVTSLGTVLLPRASYYVQHGQMDEFRKISRKALNFVTVAATPLMLYFILFARDGILLLSGELYLGAVVPMQLIMPTLLFIGLTNILGIQILVPTGREKLVLYSVIVGAATDVVCNLLLIPGFAAAGAAMSNMIAEAAVLVFQIIALRGEVGFAFRSISYWKIGLGLVAGTAASLWVATLGLGSFLSLLVSACLFFGAYGVVLLVTREPLVKEVVGQLFGKLFKKAAR
jgi:O-antigen/teichoic acid export membrane protein